MKRLPLFALFIALCCFAVSSLASNLVKEREEFHQSYAISANGALTLKNVNGPIHIKVWNESRVEVNAVKEASTKEMLDLIKIDVKAQGNSINIDTIYPKNRNSNGGVSYELSVPRTLNLNGIESVNGAVSIEGVQGRVTAKTVNGSISVEGGNTVNAETVNGSIKATLKSLENNQQAKYQTVNGSITLTMNEGLNADIQASTLNGKINSDLPVQIQGRLSSKQLKGRLGAGGGQLSLETLNGSINLNKSALN